MKTFIITFWLGSFLLPASAFAMGSKPVTPPPDPKPAAVEFKFLNFAENQRLSQNALTLLRVQTSQKVEKVQVFANGGSLGFAEFRPVENEYRISHKFQQVAEFDLKFVAINKGKSAASKTVRVSVVKADDPVPTDPAEPPAPTPPSGSAYFNSYILKAIAFIENNHGLLGYNINSQLTHDLQFSTFGTMKATGGGKTMCVAAQLEIIVVALQIYAKETGDMSVYEYLPFNKWNSLVDDGLKAQIWVDPKLDSYGTADALWHFGMGELTSWERLEPGDFLNINRVNGSGHAVTFVSYIDKKGNELPKYDATAVGFKYFSSQGGGAKGEGGMSYRWAFFDKNGCPEIPYKRDCGLVFRAADRKFLSMGKMWHPKNWKHTSRAARAFLSQPIGEPSAADMEFFRRPARFNGLTTDD